MKLKKDNDFESMFVTTFAFKKISNKIEKQFELLFKQIENYKNDFGASEWVLLVISVVVMIIILGLIIAVIVLLARKYIRFRKSLVEQEEMLDEIADLNSKVETMVNEREDILAMKVSQLGLKTDKKNTEEITAEEETPVEEVSDDDIRFSKLLPLSYDEIPLITFFNPLSIK